MKNIYNLLLYYSIIFIFLYLTGIRFLKVLSGFTLGAFILCIMQTILLGLALYLIYYIKINGLKFYSATSFARMNIILLFLLLPLGLILFAIVGGGWLNIGWLNITCFLIGALLFFTFLISIICILIGKGDSAVIIYIISLPFMDLLEKWSVLATFKFDYFIFNAATVYLLCLFAAFILNIDPLKYKLPRIIRIIFLIYLCFFVSAIISSCFSKNIILSINDCVMEYGYIALIVPLIVFNFRNKKQIYNLAKAIFLMIAIFAFITIYINMSAVLSSDALMAVSSLAMPVLLILPLGFALFLTAKKGEYILYLPTLLFLIYIFILHVWRAGIIAMILAFPVFLFEKKARIAFCWGILAVIIIYFITGNELIQEYSTHKDMNIAHSFSDSSLIFRVKAWAGAINIIKDNPLLGIGCGMWDEYVVSYITPQPVAHPTIRGRTTMGYIIDPHNQYLKIYLDAGIVGFLLFISLCVIFLKEAISLALKNKQDEDNYLFALSFISCFIGFLVTIIFGGWFHWEGSNMTGLIFMIIIGLFLAFRNVAGKELSNEISQMSS